MSTEHPPVIQFNSPWSYDAGKIRVPSPPAGLSAEQVSELLQNGELKQPYIFDTGEERRLHFRWDSVQSVMRLNEPDSLVIAYTRKMMAFLLFNPDPVHIVMIGLGGGSLAKFCYRHLRKTHITVVEVDAGIITLRDEFYVPKDNHRFRIVHDDGAHYMSTLTEPVDVILVDAFDSIGIPPSFSDSDFYEQCAAMLAHQGVLVMNFSGEHARYPRNMERIRNAFDGTTLLVPVAEDNNIILFAFKKKLLLTTSSESSGKYKIRAQQLQAMLNLEFSSYWDRICEAEVLA